MKRLIPFIIGILLAPFALGQSVPNGAITQGQVWTAAQWNAAWKEKLDLPLFTGIPYFSSMVGASAANALNVYSLFGCSGSASSYLNGAGGCTTPGSSAPAGSEYDLQINGGSGAFGYVSGVSGGILIGQTSAVPIFQPLTGDCSITIGGVITCLKTNGVNFGTFATANATAPPAIGGVTPAAGAFTALTVTSGVVGSPTGGNEGAGTINAQGVYVNGAAVGTSSGANPSASIGLSAINGSATNYMRSDGAPALSQAIAPTWTGNHIFAGSGVAITVNASNSSPSVVLNGFSGSPNGLKMVDGQSGNAVWQIEDGFCSSVSPGVFGIYSGALTTSALCIGTDGGIYAPTATGGDKGVGTVNAANYYINGTVLGTLATANALTPPAIGGTTPAAGSFTTLTGASSVIGSPTGGNEGAGTLNATELFVNGSAVATTNTGCTTGSFSPTWAGFSSAPSATVTYVLCGYVVSLNFRNGGLGSTGTSNATSMSLTGLPSAIQPTGSEVVGSCLNMEDNSVTGYKGAVFVTGGAAQFAISIVSGSNILDNLSGFTGSGSKGIGAPGSCTYALQ